MNTIQDIRPAAKVAPKKIAVTFIDDEPLDKSGFTARISELSSRINYPKELLSSKERFMRALRRHSR